MRIYLFSMHSRYRYALTGEMTQCAQNNSAYDSGDNDTATDLARKAELALIGGVAAPRGRSSLSDLVRDIRVDVLEAVGRPLDRKIELPGQMDQYVIEHGMVFLIGRASYSEGRAIGVDEAEIQPVFLYRRAEASPIPQSFLGIPEIVRPYLLPIGYPAAFYHLCDLMENIDSIRKVFSGYYQCHPP